MLHVDLNLSIFISVFHLFKEKKDKNESVKLVYSICKSKILISCSLISKGRKIMLMAGYTLL